MRTWQQHVEYGTTPRRKRSRLLEGLRHAKRFIKAVAHEDDCEAHPDEPRRGRMCTCGRNLAVEQIDAAIKAIRK